MIVSDIWEEIVEATGQCSEAQNFRTLTLALKKLAVEGVFDPMVGYLDFELDEDQTVIALPREVKTPLRLNINRNPTFFRNRLFEFTLNTEGNQEGEVVGWSWADRGNIPIQDESDLPGVLGYACEDSDDNDKTITVYGRDADGREISEALEADSVAPTFGALTFHQITRIVREATTSVCLLHVTSTANIAAQYYPDETSPSYRVIKVSKPGASIHMHFLRHVFRITSQSDVIPLSNELAVIHACKAVRFLAIDEYEKGQAALAFAVEELKKEQAHLDAASTLSGALEQPSAIDHGIFVREGIVVADVYDAASETFGPIGRTKLFDQITEAIETLRNKAEWDAGTGIVDVWTPDRSEIETVHGAGSGHFVLPRFVESVISLNYSSQPAMPRNQWFEFHLNGSGESAVSSVQKWDYTGEVVIINELPVDGTTKRVVPVRLLAVAEEGDDVDDTRITRVFGRERLSDDTEIDVWRDGQPGWVLPNRADGTTTAESDSPWFVSITRITRADLGGYAATGFVRVYGLASGEDFPGTLLGLWYPDEFEPRYTRIKVQSYESARLRVFYRSRFSKISSLYQPIPLRSKRALKLMFKAMVAEDSQEAVILEERAVRLLSEERINTGQNETGSLQFDPGTMPGHNYNIT